MNPYEKYLDGRDVLDVLRATPAALQTLTAGLTPEQMDTPPSPGKWSVREILVHLADCEIVFAFRLRQALENPGSTITPFDQDIWASRYSAYSAANALRTFLANREWNLSLLATVSELDGSKSLFHPEHGVVSFQVLVETIAGHDLNHLSRLRARIA